MNIQRTPCIQIPVKIYPFMRIEKNTLGIPRESRFATKTNWSSVLIRMNSARSNLNLKSAIRPNSAKIGPGA